MKIIKIFFSRTLFQECGLLILVHTFDPTDEEGEAGLSHRACGHPGKRSEF